MTTEERSRQIIWLAYELLRTGKARGWSEAMARAKRQVDNDLWAGSPAQ